MERRQFLGSLGVLGVSSVAAIPVVRDAKRAVEHPAVAQHNGLRETVTYDVSGFTCITCAVGLETILGRMEGVLAVHADYPKAMATVAYDPARVTEAQLRAAISGMGFTAQPV